MPQVWLEHGLLKWGVTRPYRQTHDSPNVIATRMGFELSKRVVIALKFHPMILRSLPLLAVLTGLARWFLFSKTAAICVTAALFIGPAESTRAHDDHGTNVLIDISMTNNNRVVLSFDTQPNKFCSVQ